MHCADVQNPHTLNTPRCPSSYSNQPPVCSRSVEMTVAEISSQANPFKESVSNTVDEQIPLVVAWCIALLSSFNEKLLHGLRNFTGPRPPRVRCTSIKKVTIFREFPLYHRCRPSFPFAARGASIDAGVGVCGLCVGACCSPRARLPIRVWLSGRRHLLGIW